jgi:predicted enzyme related to lactoylglutathione lyase
VGDQRGAHVWYVTMDCRDPERLAAFWKDLLEVEIAGTFGKNFVFLKRPSQDALAMAFQRVPEDKVGKNRAHVDVHVEDLEATTTWIEANGGRRIEDHLEEDLHWRVVADPENNEFCLVPVHQGTDA